MNVLDFYRKKEAGEKITVITCYDYTSARILAETSIDCLLVGDSAAMTMHGFKDTLAATIPMMEFHTAAVSRGAGKKFVVSDMPFLSYRKSLSENMSAVEALMRAGGKAVKLEGAAGNELLIRHLVESGVPVMGHLGLTPQSIHAFGGYKVQGKTQRAAEKLKQDAVRLQEEGCFSIVLECVPALLAKEITQTLAIPTIGIGAGVETDGQVLVFQDLLGLNPDMQPRFVKQFMQGKAQITKGVEDYVRAIKAGEFPGDEHCYND